MAHPSQGDEHHQKDMNTQGHTPRSFPDAIAALDSLTFKIIKQPQLRCTTHLCTRQSNQKSKKSQSKDLAKKILDSINFALSSTSDHDNGIHPYPHRLPSPQQQQQPPTHNQTQTPHPSTISPPKTFAMFSSLTSLQPRQLFTQILNFALVLSTAFMLWKGLSITTDSSSPIVVVLSGSMEPAFQRGDLLFLWNRGQDTKVGEVVVYNVKGKDIPIVHRVVRRFGGGSGLVLPSLFPSSFPFPSSCLSP
jgi:hypothetical protein